MTREIFVVDDNTDYQFIFFKVLKDLDKPYSVKFFENARACHQHLETLQIRQDMQMPALIITDFNMPGMNGLQLLKRLKGTVEGKDSQLSEIPVVVMSSGFLDHQINQCYDSGANAVIPKPTDLMHLKTTIKGICRFWLNTREHANHTSFS